MKFVKFNIRTNKFILFIFFQLLITQLCFSTNDNDVYKLRRIDYQQGLSNSAVLCLFQDNNRLMWFGTYDGVNCWDGKNMEVSRSDFSLSQTLSNNVIHSILQADSNCLWISTHLGINRLSNGSGQVVGNYSFVGDYYLHSNLDGNTWVVGQEGVFYYNIFHKRFVRINLPGTYSDNMDKRSFVADDGTLWIFPLNSGKTIQISHDSFSKDSTTIQTNILSTDFHSKPINDVFYQNGIICFIDAEQDLYVYDISRRTKIYIRNISQLVQKNGVIVGIVPFYEDIVIGFRTNGLMRLRTSEKYKEEEIDRNIRIYDLYRDPNQNVRWVASDGQGAIMYSKKYSIANNVMLNQLSPNLSRQVRSVMTDKYGGLWFGTKGDGLVHILNYKDGINVFSSKVFSLAGQQNLSTYKRWDKEYAVYKLIQSRYSNGFWVASGVPGLCYFSFSDNNLHALINNDSGQPIEVHDLYEENDSVLYVVTAGNGFSKLTFKKEGNAYKIRYQKPYHFYHEQREITMFYPMLAENDSILWLGSREKGLIRFNKHTEEYQVISLKELLHKSVDDVLSLCYTKNGRLYVGTTSGLVCLTYKEKHISAYYIGREQGLLNDMIHGILEDGNGLLWLSTNKGLIKYNPANGSSHAYYYTAGVQIGEFSDDAYYQCPYTGRLFFGGIDGLLYIDNEVGAAPKFYPSILLRKIYIGRVQKNLGDYYKDDKVLIFKGNSVSFTLSFVVPDYISGNDIEYSYKLDGYDKKWTSFSSLNEISYNELPAGKYILKIKYKRDVFDTEYQSIEIPINVISPWYSSMPAYIIYSILLLSLLTFIGYLLRKNILQLRLMKKLLNSEHKQKQSEETNGNLGELGRLTLIYNCCDQLRAENITYEQRMEIVSLIRETVMSTLLNPNSLKMEELKQFFPDKFILAARLTIEGISQQVLRTLHNQGITNIAIHSDIPEQFTFPVYKNAIYSVFYFCYYQIAHSTVTTGVTVSATEKNQKMLLLFTSADNTVKDLNEYLTDNSSHLSSKDSDQLFSFNLMSCFVKSALERIHATLHFESLENLNCLTIAFEPANMDVADNQNKKTVLLLENRDEMTWLIGNFLAEEYNVRRVDNVQLAFDEIRKAPPALLLVDMTMYVDSENSFIEYVRKNRTLLSKTTFIPMLTWKVSSTLQRELILWSDSYIVFPYDIIFIREIVFNAIYGKRKMKQIYMDDLGELASQVTCSTEEQANFVRNILQVIEDNLDNEELGSTLIADRLAMSSRQFYRKFKEISDTAPGDLIKNYRMEKAASLLRNEDLSIQDVIAEVGISSRSYFYKEFTRRFGMTPKEYRENMGNTDKNNSSDKRE